MSRLDDIAERNVRAMRDARRKLAWAAAIVASLIAVAVGVSAGFAKPHVPDHGATRLPAPEPATRVDGVLLR